MGGAVKTIANVATLGLAGGVLGKALDNKDNSASSTTTEAVDTNEVSSADAENLANDKRRRAKAGGLSSTILGGASAAAAPTTTKTLLGQ